jgi:uncharacterized protein
LDPLAVLSGFAVGAIVGMTGVGGGSLMTPLLMGVFKLHPAVAIGTDLAFAGITKAGGALAHSRQSHVCWPVVLLMLAGSVPAACATLAVMHFSELGKSSTGAMTFTLGIALLLTAMTVLWRRAWSAIGQRLQRVIPARQRNLLTLLSGVFLGVIVTLSSIGAGAIGAALILLLQPQLKAHEVVGTDIVHAVPLTLVAAAGHAWLGHVDYALLAALLVGSLPGIWLGARLTTLMPERFVRALLCTSLVTAGLKVIA